MPYSSQGLYKLAEVQHSTVITINHLKDGISKLRSWLIDHVVELIDVNCSRLVFVILPEPFVEVLEVGILHCFRGKWNGWSGRIVGEALMGVSTIRQNPSPQAPRS